MIYERREIYHVAQQVLDGCHHRQRLTPIGGEDPHHVAADI